MSRKRTISYFSLTAGGTLLALRLRDRFGGNAHLPRCYSLGCRRCDPFDSIAEALPQAFESGETVVCVMAAGIVFRVLAPYLKTKQQDPAVIVIDEEGRHVVPLLGGHAAGANGLARQIAGFLGASAAVTTASDSLGLIAPDEVAERLGADIEDPAALRKIAALVVDGRPVCIEAPCDPGIEGYGWIDPGASSEGYAGRLLVDYMSYNRSNEESRAGDTGDAGHTAHPNSDCLGTPPIPTARLIPKVIAAGIGCKRGASMAQINDAINEACSRAGIDPRSLGTLASVEAKRDEAGLRAAAARLDVRLDFFTAAQLAALGRPGSDFVADQVGTPAVCEPAALLAAGRSAVLLAEKWVCGPVTVALAIDHEAAASHLKQQPAAAHPTGPQMGSLLVVGTGAGTGDVLTEEAHRAIKSADVILGYRTYTEQLRAIFPGKEYRSGHMGAEVERCNEALALARAGMRVVMVSSGDPGVYGMAGPLLEMADGVPVGIVPGVTAAQLAAARLGAPLMNDYVTLSLSDLLTPRNEVIRRASQAAESDLVVCLYNPTSRKRQPLFEEVCAIFAMHRPAETPVGWVHDAGGPGEDAGLCELKELVSRSFDMRTIIIIGNSHTAVIDGRMVTRRGYQRKKQLGKRRKTP